MIFKLLFLYLAFLSSTTMAQDCFLEPLNYIILNQGVETNRFYVSIRVAGEFYTIPVINGSIPEIKRNNPNCLVLDYINKIQYVNLPRQNAAYVEYDRIDSNEIIHKKLKQIKSPSPIQSIEQSLPKPIPNPTPNKSPDLIKKQGAPSRESDQEIEDFFLNSPSKIKTKEREDTKSFPRYN